MTGWTSWHVQHSIYVVCINLRAQTVQESERFTKVPVGMRDHIDTYTPYCFHLSSTLRRRSEIESLL